MRNTFFGGVKIFVVFIALLMIIINDWQAEAKSDNIAVDITDFPITINYEVCDNEEYSDYPMLMYKNIAYIPLTYYNGVLLGVDIKLEDNTLYLSKAALEMPSMYVRPQMTEERKENKLMVSLAPFNINIDGKAYLDE